METYKINELPEVNSFTFAADNGKYYRVVAKKVSVGYIVTFYENQKIIDQQGLKWQIPPDYIAAKELLEAVLNK